MHLNDKMKQFAVYGFALLATAFWAGNYVVAYGLADSIHPF